MMLTLLMMLQATAVPAGGSDTVIVKGRPLDDTKRELDACLARRCPPKEDMAATLAHAENQFMAGHVSDARHTLRLGRGRNARYAATYPVDVADLTRAYARMTSFDGYVDLSRILTIDTLDALKAGLARDDARVLMQRLENGAEYTKQGRVVAAEEVYQTVRRQAHQAGLPVVEGYALLRSAVLYGALASIDSAYRQAARHRIEQIERTTEPALAPFRDAALVLRAQVAALYGDKAGLERAIAAIPPRHDPEPLLIYAPPIRNGLKVPGPSRSSQEPQWADVSFSVAGDGTVGDIEVLRNSTPFDAGWFADARRSLEGRRYAPIVLPPGTTGVPRAERFLFVLDVTRITGSRMRARSGGRVETLDITPATRIAAR